LAPSVSGFLFVSEIYREQLNGLFCAQFTPKTCLGLRSDEFEGRGQRSRSPGTETAFFGPFGCLSAVNVW